MPDLNAFNDALRARGSAYATYPTPRRHLQGNVLMTGGAGYLGRGILRRAMRESWPCTFTIYSRDEEKQYRLRQRYPDAALRFVLGDVQDRDRLDAAMPGHDLVIHTAAVKFVPEAEYNVAETVGVNVTGTLNVARAAARAGVKRAVLVSTDKACLPVNLYGATKMIAERIWTEANQWGNCIFNTARYGNVVGSTGSIVPVFWNQLLKDNVVKVTDPDMTRFWMSIEEAVDLVVSALVGAGVVGGVIVARCPAMKIGDVAQSILSEDSWGRIEIVGPRPGEKKHETLLNDYEAARSALMPPYMVVLPATSMLAEEIERARPYSSDNPDRWLSIEEMRVLIADSVEV